MITPIVVRESPVLSSHLVGYIRKVGRLALQAYCRQERLALDLGTTTAHPCGSLDRWLVRALAYSADGSTFHVTANVDSNGTEYVAFVPGCGEGFSFVAILMQELMNEVRPPNHACLLAALPPQVWNAEKVCWEKPKVDENDPAYADLRRSLFPRDSQALGCE